MRRRGVTPRQKWLEMRISLAVSNVAVVAVCLSIAPASAFDRRSPGLPPSAFADPGAVYDYGPGFALLKPWYLDPEYRVRRYYRARDPRQYPMPVYIEPNYRMSGGYPHAYPLTGYIYPYPQVQYVPPPVFPMQPERALPRYKPPAIDTPPADPLPPK